MTTSTTGNHIGYMVLRLCGTVDASLPPLSAENAGDLGTDLAGLACRLQQEPSLLSQDVRNPTVAEIISALETYLATSQDAILQTAFGDRKHGCIKKELEELKKLAAVWITANARNRIVPPDIAAFTLLGDLGSPRPLDVLSAAYSYASNLEREPKPLNQTPFAPSVVSRAIHAYASKSRTRHSAPITEALMSAGEIISHLAHT